MLQILHSACGVVQDDNIAAASMVTEGRSAAVIWMLPDYCFSPVYILQMPNVKAL